MHRCAGTHQVRADRNRARRPQAQSSDRRAAMREDADDLVDSPAAEQEVEACTRISIAQHLSEGRLRHGKDLTRRVYWLEAHLNGEAAAAAERAGLELETGRSVWSEDAKHQACTHIKEEEERRVRELLRAAIAEARSNDRQTDRQTERGARVSKVSTRASGCDQPGR